MKYFFVILLTKNNTKKNIILKNTSLEALINKINKDKYIIYKITEIPMLIGKITDFFEKKTDTLTLIDFLKNFHIMLKSGISITEIIEDMQEDEKNKALNILLNDMEDSLKEGDNLSDVFLKYNWIPEVVPKMIEMGEKTGNLITAFKKAIDYLERIYYLKRNLIKAITYPTLTFITIIIAFLYWLIGVLPKLMEFFTSMNLTVPWITQKMSIFGLWLSSSYLIPLTSFVVIFFIVYVYIKRPQQIAKQIDQINFRIPLIGKIIKYYNMAYIADFLSMYLSSGFGIYETIKELKLNLKNRSYKEEIIKIEKNILLGDSLHETLIQNKFLFSSYFIRMLKSGENTGEIDKQAAYVADKYYEDIEYIADNIQKILSPAIMLIVMGFILTIIFAFIAPIYQSFGQLK